MQDGDDFVEVRASRNVFSKDYARKKRLALPRSWVAGEEGSNTLLSPIFPLSMVLVGAMAILTET